MRVESKPKQKEIYKFYIGDQRSESFELVVTIRSKKTKMSNPAAIEATDRKSVV